MEIIDKINTYIKLIKKAKSFIDPNDKDNCLQNGWDGYNANQISNDIIDKLLVNLSYLYSDDLINEHIVLTPVADGSITIEWYLKPNNHISISYSIKQNEYILTAVSDKAINIPYYSKDKQCTAITGEFQSLMSIIKQFLKIIDM